MASDARVDESAPKNSKEKFKDLTMSLKQLFGSVRNGQRITFTIFDAEEVTGYLAGLDTESFFVLEPHQDGFHKKVIRRGLSPVFHIHDDSTYDDETFHVEMDEIIHKFRTWMLSEYYSHTSSPRKNRSDSFDQRIA